MENTLGDLHRWKSKILHLCVFGCGAYMYLSNEVCANKLTLRSELIIFIGYEDNGYKFIYYIVMFSSSIANISSTSC